MAFKIRKSEETTYSMVPSHFVNELKKVFDEQGFSYEILYGDEIPQGMERAVELDGHKMSMGACCIRSNMAAEDVHTLMLKIWRPGKYGDLE